MMTVAQGTLPGGIEPLGHHRLGPAGDSFFPDAVSKGKKAMPRKPNPPHLQAVTGTTRGKATQPV